MTQRTAGLLLPTRERAALGQWDAAPLLDLAVTAEALAFDSVWVGDSLTARPRLEPVTLLAAIAARTNRVTVGTAAMTAALRPPLQTAGALATLDRVARGRVVLALGAGFPYPESKAEFDEAGVPFNRRLALLSETVHVWRRAWAGNGPTGFPQTTAPTGPPLWLAGSGPRALRLAASTFDGWLPYIPAPSDYAATLQRLDALAVDAGRDPTSIARGLYITVLADAAHDELDAFARLYYGLDGAALASFQAVAEGSFDACVDRLAAFASAGVQHLVIRIGSLSTERHLESTAHLAAIWRDWT